jgi:hypothetical protein
MSPVQPDAPANPSAHSEMLPMRPAHLVSLLRRLWFTLTYWRPPRKPGGVFLRERKRRKLPSSANAQRISLRSVAA